MSIQTSDCNEIEEAISNSKEVKEYFLACIKKYQKKCEIFKNAAVNCNNNISKYENILNKIKNIDNNIKKANNEPNTLESLQNTINNKFELCFNDDDEYDDDDEYEYDEYEEDDEDEDDKKDNEDEDEYDEDEYEEDEYEEDEEYDESYNIAIKENGNDNMDFIQNKYKSYYIIHNKSDFNNDNKDPELYYINITCQIKPALKNIKFGSIPETWIIPEPDKKLNSDDYKEYLKDGSLLTKIYNDMNYNMKNRIKHVLRRLIPYNTTEQFINRIKVLTKTNKYFLKTDIIGAYYNVSFKTVLDTLKANYDICEHFEKYLSGFFNFIKNKENKNEYLYISNYSPLLFAIYLKRILGDIKFISRYDDIILYGNNLDEVKQEFDKLVSTLKLHGLYLNKNKTALYNIDVNSIFILKNLVNIPASGKLDETTKNILREYYKNNEYIKIACEDKNNIIKSTLTF